MRNSLLHFVFFVLVLVLGAGLESSLPRVCGVGYPVLLACVQVISFQGSFLPAALFALAAGAFEDALGGLPMTASGSFFLLTALLVNRVGFPRGTAFLTYPLYLGWLAVWTGEAGGDVFARLLLAAPIGFVAACLAGVVITMVKRGAALDEAS